MRNSVKSYKAEQSYDTRAPFTIWKVRLSKTRGCIVGTADSNQYEVALIDFVVVVLFRREVEISPVGGIRDCDDQVTCIDSHQAEYGNSYRGPFINPT